MTKKMNVQSRIICENNDSLFNYFAWPSVAKLPDGNLAMVASGFRVGHICPFGKVIICYSKDEGANWSKPCVLIDTPLDDRDAGIAVFDNHKVIVTSFNNRVEFQRRCLKERPQHPRYGLINSYLDCVNASEAEEKFLGSTYRISEDGGYTFGALKRIPVTANHGPCVTPDHRLLYIGRNYDGMEGGKDQIDCYQQNEKGEFEYLSSIENINDEYGPLLSCEPHPIVLPDGKIIVHIRIQRTAGAHPVFTIYQSESYDHGKTFTRPHSIGLKSGAPSHIMHHSSGVLIASYGYREQPYGQRVMFSKDDGETWDTDYILRDDGPTSDLGYPATVELENGSLLTVYYQQEQGKEHCVIMQSIWKLPENIFNKCIGRGWENDEI